MDGEIGLDHGNAGPHARHEVLLGDQFAMTFDESDQNIEGAAAETNGFVRLQEETLRRQKAEGAEHDRGRP